MYHRSLYDIVMDTGRSIQELTHEMQGEEELFASTLTLRAVEAQLLIMAHTLGMFGLSVLTGPLADRLGRPLTIAGGALLLFAGSLLAPVSLLTGWLALALFLVGLGWNLCYIAGSALLADILAATERGQQSNAQATLEKVIEAKDRLQQELNEKLTAVEAEFDSSRVTIESIELKPQKSDIEVDEVSLLWLPFRIDKAGAAEPIY